MLIAPGKAGKNWIRYRVTIPAYFGDWAARFLPARLVDRKMVAHVKKRFG